MIQVSRLVGFYWVARTQGYTRAAKAFPYPVTQAAVHQQVHKLEEEIGLRLFDRVGRDRMALTPAGQKLWALVAPFFESLPAVVRSMQTNEVEGTLRIQTTSHLLRSLMPRWIRRLSRRYPQVHVELFEAGDADPSPLRRGEVDLLVDYLPVIPPDVAVQAVGTVRAFVVVPAGHPAASKPRLSFVDLRETPFVAYTPDRKHRDLQLSALEHHKIVPPYTYAVSSSESILGFVAAGLGFSIIPSLLPGGPRQAGVVTRLLDKPRAQFPILAAWRVLAADNPLVRVALELAPSKDARGPAA